MTGYVYPRFITRVDVVALEVDDMLDNDPYVWYAFFVMQTQGNLNYRSSGSGLIRSGLSPLGIPWSRRR